MANYEQLARSNYFRVIDVKAFSDFCDKWDVTLIHKVSPHERDGVLYRDLVGFICDQDNGGIPSMLFDDQDEEIEIEVCFVDELATHLSPGWVAVMFEIGWEKLRYLTGVATAVNSAGEKKHVNLDDIYDHAETLGDMPITGCMY
jgi:hypothetical protein